MKINTLLTHYCSLHNMCWDRLQHRATTRATTTASPSRKTHAQFRAFHRAFRARKGYPPTSATNAHGMSFHIFQQLSRSTLNMPHSIYTKIVCVRLPVATAIWRAIIHCYWMLVLLIQYVGLVWNPPTHLSVCHSAIAYTLYSDGWTHTAIRPNILTYRTL